MKIRKKIASILLTSILLAGLSVNVNALDSRDVRSIAGIDRYATASGIAGNFGPYENVILVNADNNMLADGLSASGLAGVLNAPILLVHKDSIPNETQLRIDIAKRIYIIGSEGSISRGLEDRLRDQSMGGFSVKRIGGVNRYETSYNVAREILSIKNSVGKVFVANGRLGEADAMSASAIAARDGEPILLTNGNNMDSKSMSIVLRTNNIYAVGGSNVISQGLVSSLNARRISGKNRYYTNSLLINQFYQNSNGSYYLSDGYKLVDALTGGPLAGKNNAPIFLVGPNNNKSILRGASELVSLGGINRSVIKQCINAANR
ncbi:cell wall-binding repeat-containing protein [Peptostreptococcus anaerobius]|uniref:Putative cell wall binding repeat 2 n=1 Tax=Peptostreptococcus anaerobius 653-L TaxID=596329 RepID=D3MPW0_9FIRM|nr:cell wall-binding repeat-containing protein [Peptostreptococcus anaerobius]EFD05809.1 putative cell wall binding repeat 2 [Peptostreptococcus anaerobius 653-L]MDK8277782.1 cell wall-binding repeat-containing protein [Peptostreptococcus anaerobius]MDU1175812.1 cell wall-binding repeat-containing protein [Peptostreptococcus anaerobius]MDU1234292.1 cell wall-binding repeat-containing protein [Peptostreptococcus anaerobius]